VLVVADPGPAREGTSRRLAAAGYAVEQASPGFAAGATAARFEPDAVVLHPSGPDDAETLHALKLDRALAAVPVVALGRAEWQAALRASGCAAALPLGGGDLEAALREALADPPRSPPRRRRSRRAAD
jgi:DNA-binding response OmpR family regulator